MALHAAMLVTVLLMAKCINAEETKINEPKNIADTQDLEKEDLKTAASSYSDYRYSDWNRYPSGYGSNYGVTAYGSIDDKYGYGGYGSYDNSYGYNSYDGGYSGYSNYPVNTGYNGYRGGNGGYGGYSGNGGLNSYYGYNNPNYQGANHLGYGYYKRPGYGNIYNSGITPNLVTGYRGYSRK